MRERQLIANVLAAALANAGWEEAALVDCCRQVLGRRSRWIERFVRRLLAQFPRPPRPRAAEMAEVITQDADFRRARLLAVEGAHEPILQSPVMDARFAPSGKVPEICTTRELADWLEITIPQLDSFADLKGLSRIIRETNWLHYHYRILAKRFGSVRLIESPKPRLKIVQRKMLREILDVVPPHEAAHGFRLGRSIGSFVAPHVGQAVVARIDLRDFFPSISRGRVAALFRTFGYPETVSKLLAGISTSITPAWLWDSVDDDCADRRIRGAQSRYAVPHLPQGAPTSPAIANLCAFRLDCRLAGLAHAAGGNYTRYADDLAFSGDDAFARRIDRFVVHVTATVAEEGFAVNHRKTRVMRNGVRQHLAGLVVNRQANIRRTDYDRLKAILVNCGRHGPEVENRSAHSDFRAHLNGRVGFVEQINPARGGRLRKLFEAIVW